MPELLREALERRSDEIIGPDGRRVQAYFIEVSLEGVAAQADRQGKNWAIPWVNPKN